ncbi:TPA: c-type cytochrome biogenesis protein CcmI [Haemophilus influenzae]|uniref:c-type cytochrome biogenesis protein CcmI n=1 Tax=Haemophilus influenzae TaxID=727 RepID=UPI0007667ED3|nr:c-type cytochrome biogenesis protein CcmI [Haemophilus influenzae]MCK8951585.1 c-type cytochrome biogenesis protein CcmI [Haemophilus influenzae]MCK9095364.1 c-type cytochrome biogenesis protein CcmI [Haemophilus influenzae]MDE4516760.1 c-type cytochrome biogenesis protein CcmI [Haemophilus influenzae]OBX53351.1 c-type cytochrome biogenesis protein CcmI [Haemophilus influenzae]ORJ42996.1 c-type cytochrome biogenesis protein CcmI [Haemophilus influenzae]
MNFTLIFILTTLVVALICFYPLLRQFKAKHGQKRDDLNKALYFSRLEEIEQDNSQGLVENVEQLKQELQKTLLDDVPSKVQENVDYSGKSYGKIWFVSGVLALGIIAGSSYFMVGSWQAESMLEQTYAKLPYFFERMKDEDKNPFSDTEMQQFSIALRIDLQKNPTDAKKWWMLGQIGMNLGDARLAFDSYQKANKLEPDNVQYKLGYARILMFSEDATDKLKGGDLLRQVIRQDHTNVEALSLLAFRYFETEDYKMAAVTWAMMLRLMPKDDERVPLIEKSIRTARDALEAQNEEKSKSITPEK